MGQDTSKSAKKREAQAVGALAKRLLDMTDDELAAVPLGDELRDVLVATRSITSRSALKRQRQYFAKRLRQSDTAAIAAACDALAARDAARQRLFHRAEEWRDRLLAEGRPALAEFCAVSGRDSARLRTLLDRWLATPADAERRRIGRELFREIHAELAAVVQRDAGSI